MEVLHTCAQIKALGLLAIRWHMALQLSAFRTKQRAIGAVLATSKCARTVKHLEIAHAYYRQAHLYFDIYRWQENDCPSHQYGRRFGSRTVRFGDSWRWRWDIQRMYR